MDRLSRTITTRNAAFPETPRRWRTQVAALPWRLRSGRLEIMLVTTRQTRRWILPRGWPEAGETLNVAAAREAREEAGIDGRIAADEVGCYFYTKIASHGRDIRCEVLVYPLEVREVAASWKEKGERARRWVGAARAALMVTEPGLGEIILAFASSLPRLA